TLLQPVAGGVRDLRFRRPRLVPGRHPPRPLRDLRAVRPPLRCRGRLSPLAVVQCPDPTCGGHCVTIVRRGAGTADPKLYATVTGCGAKCPGQHTLPPARVVTGLRCPRARSYPAWHRLAAAIHL